MAAVRGNGNCAGNVVCDVKYRCLRLCQRCRRPLFGPDILLIPIGRVAISMFTGSYWASGDQCVYLVLLAEWRSVCLLGPIGRVAISMSTGSYWASGDQYVY